MKFIVLSALLFLQIQVLCAQSNTSALEFDGIDDLDSVPDTEALLDGATAMSLSLWVRPENSNPSYPDFDAFAGYKNEQQSDFYMVQIGATQVEARFRNDNGTAYDILFNGLVLNQWNHFVFTYDGTKTSLYHNGSLVGTKVASGTMGNPGFDLLIGAVYYSDHTAFKLNGGLDEVGIWLKALSAQEVSDLMDCPPTGSETGLVGYWACNDATGEEVEDLSSGNHPGILLNGTGWSAAGIPAYDCPAVATRPTLNREPLQVYPNPINATATIKLSTPATLVLLDSKGKNVTPAALAHTFESGTTIRLEKGALTPGIYLLEAKTENTLLTQKLVVGE